MSSEKVDLILSIPKEFVTEFIQDLRLSNWNTEADSANKQMHDKSKRIDCNGECEDCECEKVKVVDFEVSDIYSGDLHKEGIESVRVPKELINSPINSMQALANHANRSNHSNEWSALNSTGV